MYWHFSAHDKASFLFNSIEVFEHKYNNSSLNLEHDFWILIQWIVSIFKWDHKIAFNVSSSGEAKV